MSKIEAPSKASRTKVSAEAKAQGILVLGMHRSGTSACTRVLNLMGCALPDDLMAAADSNETGHWESNDVVALNDEMLLTAGSSWQDWGPVNADWRESGIRNSMLAKATVLIKTHAALGPLFAVKDPRMCRLADVWVDAMAAAAVEPCIIIMLRNPAEVKESLESRDLTAPEYGQLLWLRHVLDAEYFTRGQRRTFCRYDQLLANWQAMMSRVKSDLGVVFPRNSPTVHAQIEKFLSHAHKHHDANAQSVLANPGYPEWLQRTFAIMLDWSEIGESSADYSNLDAIRHEFDRAYAAFARLVMADDIKGEAGAGSRLKRELNMQLEETQRAAEAAQLTLQQTEATAAVAVARETELVTQLSATLARAEELQSEIEKLQTEVGRQKGAESESEQLRRRQDELTAKLGIAESTLLQRQEELAQTWNQINIAEKALAEVSANVTQERERRRDSEKRVAVLEVEISELRKEIDKSAVATTSLADRFASETAKLGQIIHDKEEAIRAVLAASSAKDLMHETQAYENKRLSDRIRQLEAANQQAEGARSQTEQKLAGRFNEIARITAVLSEESRRAAEADDNVQWLRSVQQVTANFPRWWVLLPHDVRRKREHARYRRAGLFDGEIYLTTYSDVAKHGMDPLRHYILHGMQEGRQRTTPT